MIGLGEIQRQKGELGPAKNFLTDARELAEKTDPHIGVPFIIQANVGLARLAILSGNLKEAETYLAEAEAKTQYNTLTTQLRPEVFAVQGQLRLTEGDFAEAETHYSTVHNQAEALQQSTLAIEALLGQAQTRLAQRELKSALVTFFEAGRQFQLIENTNGDGASVLGVAQVHMGQQQWDEALDNCEAALIRFRQTDDQLSEADAILTRGLAQRAKGELDTALADFEQALRLYHQQRRPLGVADTRFARGSVFLLRGEFERARDEQSKAIIQVERVMNSISTPQRWGTFLRQYAEQYAETATTDLHQHNDSQARTLLQNFAGIVGSAEIIQHLRAYEAAIPIGGEELSEEEIQMNTDLVKRLVQLRRNL